MKNSEFLNLLMVTNKISSGIISEDVDLTDIDNTNIILEDIYKMFDKYTNCIDDIMFVTASMIRLKPSKSVINIYCELIKFWLEISGEKDRFTEMTWEMLDIFDSVTKLKEEDFAIFRDVSDCDKYIINNKRYMLELIEGERNDHVAFVDSQGRIMYSHIMMIEKDLKNGKISIINQSNDREKDIKAFDYDKDKIKLLFCSIADIA